MNKLMPLLILAIFVLFGCAKEDSVNISQTNEDQSIYRAELTTEGFKILEKVTYEEIMSRKSNTAGLRSNPNAMANGNFIFDPCGGFCPYSVIGHGMQNNGGAHGTVAQIDLTTGVSWLGDSHCVSTWGEDNNRAVAGWVITEDNGFFGAPVSPGWEMFTAVEDNGEGANAPSDRVNASFYVAPPGFLNCDGLANDGSFPEYSWIDIEEGGHIQVQ